MCAQNSGQTISSNFLWNLNKEIKKVRFVIRFKLKFRSHLKIRLYIVECRKYHILMVTERYCYHLKF